MKYWAYLHSNGTIQTKRWFGDVQDYTTDCKNNPFVKQVIEPFEAENDDKAHELAYLKILGRINERT